MSSAVAGLARSGAVHGTFAFLAMGAWAAFANRGHGLEAMATAGVIQGAISCAITLILKRSLEAMSARLSHYTAWLVPPLVCHVVVFAGLVTIHWLAGTPEIIATISLPFTVSSIYSWIYTGALYRRRMLEL